jgi:hypothetical protein
MSSSVMFLGYLRATTRRCDDDKGGHGEGVVSDDNDNDVMLCGPIIRHQHRYLLTTCTVIVERVNNSRVLKRTVV